MGLQGVEFLMAVEDEFGVTITDQEAQRTVTVMDLYHVILAKLREGQSLIDGEICISSHLFYRLRRALVETCGVRRVDVRPEARLAALIPITQRKSCWPRLQHYLALDLPDLSLPTGLLYVIIALAGAVVGMLLMLPSPATWPDRITFCFLAVLAALLIFVGLAALIAPLALTVPRGYQTVRETVLTLQQRHFALSSAGHTIDGTLVWKQLVNITTTELNVQPEVIKPETRIWDDLCK